MTGGKVYITGPYKGAPFGTSRLCRPREGGPFDLRKVIVRAKIDVNQETAALTITTDDEGPYKIHLDHRRDPDCRSGTSASISAGPGSRFNATNCSPLAITGSAEPEYPGRDECALGALPGHQLRGARVQAQADRLDVGKDVPGEWGEPDGQTWLPRGASMTRISPRSKSNCPEAALPAYDAAESVHRRRSVRSQPPPAAPQRP